MSDKDQSRAPSNELDMDAYHSEGIDPGEHKVFNITPTIHSFNERFQGESPVSAGPGLEGYDPNKMYDWWVKTIAPTRQQWPGDPGSRTITERGIDRSYEEPFALPTEDPSFQPISEKKPPFGGPKGPFNLPLEGSTTGTRLGSVTTEEPMFKSPIRRNPDDIKDIERMYKEGKSMSEIGEYLGINRNQVNGLINRLGLRSKDKPKQEAKNPYKVPELDKDFDELTTWYQNQ